MSTSSWPELMIKCTRNFGASATAGSTTGTGFLDLQVGWLAFVPDCSTKRLAVWFLGSASCYDRPEGVLAVSDLSNSFWYTNTLLVLLTGEQTKAQTLHRFITCSSPPLQFSAMFYKLDLTCHICPKRYTVLVNDLHLLHIFVCVTCVRTACTLTLFKQSFPTFKPTKSLKGLCSSHSTLMKRCFKGFHVF